MPEQNGIELRWILAVVRRWWWLIIGCTLLGAVVAFFVTAQIPPNYEATAILLIQPASDSRTSEYNTLVAAERLALTYSEMLKGRPVLENVIIQNQLSESVDELAKRVTATPIRDTQLIHLTVADSSAARATMLANAIAQEFTHYIESLQTERYAGTLNTLQDKIGKLSLQIDTNQIELQSLNAEKASNDAELVNLESLETEEKGKQQQLEQEYQSLQLTIAQLSERIRVAERAQISTDSEIDAINQPSASVTLLFDQALLEGEGGYSIETYQKILASRTVLQTAIDQLGLQMDPVVLDNQISLTSTPGTQLVKIEVADPDIAQATHLADTIAAVFIERMKALQAKPYTDRMSSLQSQIDSLHGQTEEIQADIAELTSENIQLETQITSLEGQLAEQREDLRSLQQDLAQMQLDTDSVADAVVIAEKASVPKEASQHRLLYVGIAGVVSGVIALGAAFLIEYLNDSIQTADDIRRVQNARALGSISKMDIQKNELATISQPRSPAAEAFRVLATQIQISNLDQAMKTILVTSPNPREGKSLVTANLAAAFAQRELSVVLVDADLRLPRLHVMFGLNLEKGLTDALLNGHPGKQLQAVGTENLKVLTSGTIPPNPAEVVASKRMSALLSELAGEAELVLVDSPPVLPVADASILSSGSIVDGVVLVVRAGSTRRQELRDAVENLSKAGANVLGVVLNGVSSRGEQYYQYYGGENGSVLNEKHPGRKLSKGLGKLFGRNGSNEKKKRKTRANLDQG